MNVRVFIILLPGQNSYKTEWASILLEATAAIRELWIHLNAWQHLEKSTPKISLAFIFIISKMRALPQLRKFHCGIGSSFSSLSLARIKSRLSKETQITSGFSG
jgi:hypothetical protein